MNGDGECSTIAAS